MLEEILAYLHNWFIVDTQHGKFAVKDGILTGCSLPLFDGQRVRISGSAAWDGVWTWHTGGPLCDSDDKTTENRADEQFAGTLNSLGIPWELVKRSQEIKAWTLENAKTINSPYQSESFNGYSYSKAVTADGGAFDWRAMFGRELFARWGKIG